MKTESEHDSFREQLPLRFPQDAFDLDNGYAPLIVSNVRPRSVPEVVFAALGGGTHNTDTLRKVAALIAASPQDFAAASIAIRPEGWRLLYVCGNAYTLEALLLPRFYANQALRDLCDLEKHNGSPPAHLLGSERSAEGIAHETAVAIQALSPSESVAAWVILSAAHALDFEEAELLSYEWWTPSWLTLVATQIRADNAQ